MEISYKGIYDRLIRRWHLGVASGLLCAVIAAVIIILLPKSYAARAVVMVDQQVELAVPPGSSLDDVLYVSRETVRLEELSYADSLWEEVAETIDSSQFGVELNITGDLRSFVSVPHFQDGAWHFMAEHSNPNFAAALANAWAEAFVDTIRAWIVTAQSEIGLRSQLETVAGLQAAAIDDCGELDWANSQVAQILTEDLNRTEYSNGELDRLVLTLRQIAASLPEGNLAAPIPNADSETIEIQAYAQRLLAILENASGACDARLAGLETERRSLLADLEAASQQSMGVSPYLRVQLTQQAEAPQTPELELGNSALVGFLIGVVLWFMTEIITKADRLSRLERGQD